MNAFETLKETYDIETLRDIRDHGCVTGVAHDHIYYRDTIKFYDEYQDEIVEHIEDVLGTEYLADIFKNNDASLDYYKNDVTWCFIELVADQLVCEYENTTCEQLSELDDDVYPALTELAKSDFWKEGHGYNDLRDSLGEIVHSKWGQDHLEIINA